MSDSVGKISLDLELQSDLSKQISESAGKIGEQLKASLQNIGNFDFSKITGSLSDTLKATMDKALSGINLSIENVFNNAGDTVSEVINMAKENALAAVAEVKKAATEMLQGVAAMSKKIKIPVSFPNPMNTPTPNSAPAINPVMPRAPPSSSVGATVKLPKIDLSSNTEYISSMIDNLTQSLDITNAKIEQQKEKLAQLKESYNRAFEGARKNKLQEQILQTEAAINKLTAVSDKTGFKLADLDKQFAILTNSTKKATAGVDSVSNKIKEVSTSAAKSSGVLGRLGKSTKETGNHFNSMNSGLSRILKQFFTWMIVMPLVMRGLTSMARFLGQSLMTNAQFANSLNQIKSNLYTAFMPVYQAALPAINALMAGLSKITAYIASFTSALFGKTYKQSFQAAKGLIAAKTAMGAYGDTAKKTAADSKKALGALAGFDEINTLNLNKNQDTGAGAGGFDSGKVPQMVMPSVDTSAIDKSMQGLASRVKAVLGTIFQPFKNAWAAVGPSVVAEFKKAIDGTKATISNFFNMLATPQIQKFMQSIGELGLTIGKLFLFVYNNYILPLGNWIIEHAPIIAKVLTPIVDSITKFLNWLMSDGKPILDTVIIILGSIAASFAIVTTAIKVFNIAKSAVAAFGLVMNFVTPQIGIVILVIGSLIAIGILLYKNWDTVSAFLKNIWNGIKTAASTIWNAIVTTIKNVFNGIGAWFSNVFTDAWNGIKKAFSSVGSFFSGIWNTIKNMFTSIGSTIGNAIGGAFRAVVNSIIGFAENSINGFIRAINGAIKLINLIPGVNIKPINTLRVPKLAKGGIIDQPTLAMVGERGKEAVMPLENNTGWITDLAGQIAALLRGNQGQNNNNITDRPIEIVIQLGGYEFARFIIDSINALQRKAGKTLLEV